MASGASRQTWIDGYWWSNDGVRLHYRDYPGDASRPPILCLPGLTRNARDFERTAERLSGTWRVIALDFRGRGDSGYAADPMSYVPLTYVQDVERLLADLKLAQVVAFGTSLGGIVSMLIAATRPEHLAGVLLNDVGPVIEPEGLARIRGYVGKVGGWPTWLHAARALAALNAQVFPHYVLDDWLAMAKRSFKLSPQGRIVADYDPRIAEPFRAPGGEVGVDLWPTLDHLRHVPVAIVRGERSDLFGAATAGRMLAMLPDATLTTVSGVGHAPMLDEPEAVAAVDGLLERVVTRMTAKA